MAQTVKNLQAMHETWVLSLSWENPLEEEMATHSSILAWEIPEETYTSALLTMPKPLCGSQQTVENFTKDGNTRPPYLHPEKPICRSGSNS